MASLTFFVKVEGEEDRRCTTRRKYKCLKVKISILHLCEPSKSVSKDIFKRNCCRILTQSKQRPSRPYPLPDCYSRPFQSSPYVQRAKPWRRNYQVLHHTHCLPLKICFFREKEFHQSNQLASQLDSL